MTLYPVSKMDLRHFAIKVQIYRKVFKNEFNDRGRQIQYDFTYMWNLKNK